MSFVSYFTDLCSNNTKPTAYDTKITICIHIGDADVNHSSISTGDMETDE